MSAEREQFSPAMESALREVERLVERGIGMHEACVSVARKWGFMTSEVTRAYDIRETARRNGGSQ